MKHPSRPSPNKCVRHEVINKDGNLYCMLNAMGERRKLHPHTKCITRRLLPLVSEAAEI